MIWRFATLSTGLADEMNPSHLTEKQAFKNLI